MNSELKRVLSVQSHVVHGYVGNRAATFPLQLRGWDVDALNSVQLSNHTGYGSFRGTKATAAELKDVYQGLKDIGFEYDAFLTGYVPTAEAVEEVGEIGKDIRTRFPDSLWLLDPVMGDEGKLYVSEAVIPVYKNILKSGAVSIITPNGFEAEILTGVKISSLETAQQAIEVLHTAYKVPHVVLSSVSLPQSHSSLYSFASTTLGDGTFKSFYFKFPVLESYFTGTGDLFAAMLLDRFHKYLCVEPTSLNEPPLLLALEEVLGLMHSVLVRTMDNAKAHGGPVNGVLGDAASMKSFELQVIACRDIILDEDLPTPYSPTFL
jgi:pyridoxine kinase